jgi:SAM-dependent methyltransferase
MTRSSFSYAAWLRDSRRLYGVLGTIKRLATGGFELLRDSLPSRRRARYGDLDFDWEQRVDTTWSNVSFGTRVREVFVGRGYQPTDPEIFREMMEQVRADLRDYTFIDLGSGKGRALLLAREFPFTRIVGMELLPELHAVAQQNVARLPEGERGHFELLCGDARQFAFPTVPTFVYLFDPFPAPILAEVMTNLERSLAQAPRPVLIGYQNPVSEEVVAASPRFTKLGGTIQWALFRNA